MDRVTADDWSDLWPPLAAPAIIGRLALREVRHCPVDGFLWQLFPDDLQGFVWNIWYFPAWRPRCGSPVDSNLESLTATLSCQWTCSRSVSSAWRRTLRNGGCLGWNTNFVIFLYILTGIGDKVYIWSFISQVNFMQKFIHTAETSTKVSGGLLCGVQPVGLCVQDYKSTCNGYDLCHPG